jgi:hypothetical protein
MGFVASPFVLFSLHYNFPTSNDETWTVVNAAQAES